MNKEIILEAKAVSKIFYDADRELEIFKSIDLSVSAGERVGIIGSSGAGKSTLLHILGGLDAPTAGQIHLCGVQLEKANETTRCRLRNQKLGFVYQFHHLLPEFTALENVMMPLFLAGKSAKAAATDLLERVGSGARLHHKPAQLSGGEKQRVAIARALVHRPACLLADEPTGNLDEETAAQIIELLLNLNAEFKTSLIIVTHDLKFAARLSTPYLLAHGTLQISRPGAADLSAHPSEKSPLPNLIQEN